MNNKISLLLLSFLVISCGNSDEQISSVVEEETSVVEEETSVVEEETSVVEEETTTTSTTTIPVYQKGEIIDVLTIQAYDKDRIIEIPSEFFKRCLLYTSPSPRDS